MERKSIVPESGSYLDRLGSAIDNTVLQTNHLSELSRNVGLLKGETPFIDKELNSFAKIADVYNETKTFYEEVRNNPINLDYIEDRILRLRAKLVEINDNPALIKKGLEPFIPIRSVPISESSYLSPVPTNRSRQSRTDNSQVMSVPDHQVKPMPDLNGKAVPDQQVKSMSVQEVKPMSVQKVKPVSVQKVKPVPDPEVKPEVVNKEPEEPAIKYNISDPELNSIMERLAKWKTN